MRMGIILSRIRMDEKRLIAEANLRDVEVVPLDNKALVFELEQCHLDMVPFPTRILLKLTTNMVHSPQ